MNALLRIVLVLSAVAAISAFQAPPAPRVASSTELYGILGNNKKGGAPRTSAKKAPPKKAGFTFGAKKAAPKPAAKPAPKKGGFSFGAKKAAPAPAPKAAPASSSSGGIVRGFSKQWNPVKKPFTKDPDTPGYITRGFSKTWNPWKGKPFTKDE